MSELLWLNQSLLSENCETMTFWEKEIGYIDTLSKFNCFLNENFL